MIISFFLFFFFQIPRQQLMSGQTRILPFCVRSVTAIDGHIRYKENWRILSRKCLVWRMNWDSVDVYFWKWPPFRRGVLLETWGQGHLLPENGNLSWLEWWCWLLWRQGEESGTTRKAFLAGSACFIIFAVLLTFVGSRGLVLNDLGLSLFIPSVSTGFCFFRRQWW